MNETIKSYLSEMEREAGPTRQLLGRVPNDKLDWQPHPKSMPLGRLALHVATVTEGFAQMMEKDSVDTRNLGLKPLVLKSAGELVPAFEECLRTTHDILAAWDDAKANGNWQLIHEGEAFISSPRTEAFRRYSLNHWYHHRAQLGVYLRLLDVPLPMTYGPTADESPE